ncbi:MAG: DUF4350 domain-containing protein [Flavobacteriales bacterium]
MLKNNWNIISLLLVLFALAVYFEVNKPEKVDWSLSYSKEDKIPFGDEILYKELNETLFKNDSVVTTDRRVFNTLKQKKEGYNYIFISNSFNVDELDTEYLLDYVKSGNSAFIASKNFSKHFLDTLGLEKGEKYNITLDQVDSAEKEVDSLFNAARLNFSAPGLKKENGYFYEKGLGKNYFSDFDSSRCIVLGTDDNGSCNFIKMNLGKGELYIHTIPNAFTNYFIAHKENHEYAFSALSYLPQQNTIWDEYYKPGANLVNTSPFRFILDTPSLRIAYYLLLLCLLFYLLFTGKREQRPIRVIKPLENTTLEFIDVLGRLYHQKGQHIHIANKKIEYFLEYIRSTYNIDTKEFDERFYEKLSKRSGVPVEEVSDLFDNIRYIKKKSIVTTEELIELNGKIEGFRVGK